MQHSTGQNKAASKAPTGAPRAAALAWLALLAACADTPQRPAPTLLPEPAPSPLAPAATPPTSPLTGFGQQQRAAADAAARQGRWRDAMRAWDVVMALQPGDADAAAQRQRAEAAAQAGVAERLPRARQAQQRGDSDSAARLWLEVLALAPQQAEAADALRSIERGRAKRAALAGTSRAARAAAPEMASGAAHSAATRNALEHASLLAGQGEIDAAITLLQPLAGARNADPSLRGLLSDLYWRQATRLAPIDRAGAIRALERWLRLQPSHSAAQQLLRQLRSLSAAPSSASP